MKKRNLFFWSWDTIAKSKRLLLLLMGVIFLITTSCQKDEFIPFDDGMLKSATVTKTVIWGPQTVYAGKLGYSGTITIPTDTYETSLTLTLTNGDGLGMNTVSGVTVTINGATVISSVDLRKQTSVTKTIANNPSLEIIVSAKGKSTNFVTVKIEGVELPHEVTIAGKTYPTVKIGNLTWMAENLAYLPFVNKTSGEPHLYPLYYVYEYYGIDVSEAKATTNYKTYGVLYNHVAALSSCPEGWRLPTKEDWEYLARQVDANYIDYQNNVAGKELKSTTGWDGLPGGMNGTNSVGFNGLSAGWYDAESGTFQAINATAIYWSADYYFNQDYYKSILSSYNDVLKIAGGLTTNGYSVRYVKGALPTN